LRRKCEDVEAGQERVQRFAGRVYDIEPKRDRPHNPVLLQTLQPEAEAVLVPPNDFDPVTAPVAEYEQRRLHRIRRHRRLHRLRKGVDLLPHVDRRPTRQHFDLGATRERRTGPASLAASPLPSPRRPAPQTRRSALGSASSKSASTQSRHVRAPAQRARTHRGVERIASRAYDTGTATAGSALCDLQSDHLIPAVLVASTRSPGSRS